MTRSRLRCCCHGEIGRGRGVAASDCALLRSSHSASLPSISGFCCWALALGCRSYDGQDGGLRACWLHLLLMERGMRRRRGAEERGGSCCYRQQRWRSLRRSMWTVKKKRSPGCAAVGRRLCRGCPGGDCPRCGRPEKKKKKKGRTVAREKKREPISKTWVHDPSRRTASPGPDRLMRTWQDSW